MFTDPDRIQSLLANRFGGLSVLVIGDVMLDRYLWGSVQRISPEAPVPIVRVSRHSASPGGASNVALNLVACGLRPTLLGTVGADAAGQTLRDSLTAAGIGAELLACAGRPTTTKTRVIGGHQQMLRLDEEEDGALPAASADALRQHAARLIAALRPAAIILSDYGKGVLGPELCREVIAAARATAVPVLVDPKGRDWGRYRGATAIKPNQQELSDATGIPARDGPALEAAGRALVAELELGFLAFSRGADGVSILDRARVTTLPAEAREVFDVSGAGDTMIALLAAGVASGLDPVEAARLANLGSGVVVGKVGTVPVAIDELHDAFAATQHGLGGKVMAWAEAAGRIAGWRQRGQRVVFTNGCFDILHPGHVRLLEQAREAGDRLVVGLNSDASVGRLKGPNRPMNPQADRAAVLSGLASVDGVVVFEQDTPLELINALRPDVLVKGADYAESAIVGAAEVRSWGGEVLRIGLVPGKSSSAIIGRIGDRDG